MLVDDCKTNEDRVKLQDRVKWCDSLIANGLFLAEAEMG